MSFHTSYSDTGLWGLYGSAEGGKLEDFVFNVQQEWVRISKAATDSEVRGRMCCALIWACVSGVWAWGVAKIRLDAARRGDGVAACTASLAVACIPRGDSPHRFLRDATVSACYPAALEQPGGSGACCPAPTHSHGMHRFRRVH